MNEDSLFARIKHELPDNLEDLEQLLHVFQQSRDGQLAGSNVDENALKSVMANCFSLASQHVGQVRRAGSAMSTATTIPATVEELAAAGRIPCAKRQACPQWAWCFHGPKSFKNNVKP